MPNRSMHVAAYIKQFMFDPKLLNAKISTLSGGEVNRLLLAKILINPGSLLILDEPTNDLDMDSLEILLDMLADYTGTLIVVSHDRDFLYKLVTRTLVFTKGAIIDLNGVYQDYQEFLQDKTHKKDVIKLPPQLKPQPRGTTTKLSYKYQRLLETLPLEIEKLELEIDNIELELSDNALYLSNPTKYHLLTNQLMQHKQKFEELLAQWVEIQ